MTGCTLMGVSKQDGPKAQRLVGLPIGERELDLDFCIDRNSSPERYSSSLARRRDTAATEIRSGEMREEWHRVVKKEYEAPYRHAISCRSAALAKTAIRNRKLTFFAQQEAGKI